MLGRVDAPCKILILALCAFLESQAVAQEPGTQNPHLLSAIKLYESLEEAAALKDLDEALKWPANTVSDTALAYIYIGLCHFNLDNDAGAWAAFDLALKIKPDVALPEVVSPKVRDFFASIKASIPAPAPGPPPSQEPAPGPPATEVPAPPAAAKPIETPTPEAPKPPAVALEGWPKEKPVEVETEEEVAARAARAKRKNLLPVLIAGGSVMGLAGSGLVFGLLAKISRDKADEAGVSAPRAAQLEDEARGRALVANVLYGASAAALFTSVLLYVYAPSEKVVEVDNASSLLLVPLGDGLAITGEF